MIVIILFLNPVFSRTTNLLELNVASVVYCNKFRHCNCMQDTSLSDWKAKATDMTD